MPSKRHRREVNDGIETVDAARARLSRLGEVDRNIQTIRDVMQAAIENHQRAIDNLYREDLDTLMAQQAEITNELERFLTVNRETLLPGRAKSVRWDEGRIGFRTGQLTVEFDKKKEDAIIAFLKRTQHGECVAVTESVDKKATSAAFEHNKDESIPFRVRKPERFFAAPADHDGTVDHDDEASS